MNFESFSRCVERNYGTALVTKACEDGCRLGLRDQSERIIIDLNRLCMDKDSKKGDFLVIVPQGEVKPLKAVALELKSGKLGSVTRVAKQLQSALNQLEAVLATCSTKVVAKAVVLHGRGIHANDVRALRAQKLKFQNRQLAPLAKCCGTELSAI